MTYQELEQLATEAAVLAAPISKSRLIEFYELMQRYGPANCWTGTTGELCGAVRSLLIEIVRLRHDHEDLLRSIRWVIEVMPRDEFGAVEALEQQVQKREVVCSQP